MVSRKWKKGAGKFLLLAALMIGAFYAGFPAVWMAVSSFKPNTDIFAYPP